MRQKIKSPRLNVLAFGCGLVALLAGCGGSQLPIGTPGTTTHIAESGVRLIDTTSILKKLTKDVVIGSTVDPTDGDTGPHSIVMATSSHGKIDNGDLVICNFADSAGHAGHGTTIELLKSVAGSKPATFTQSSDIEGCDGAAISPSNSIWASGLTSNKVGVFSPDGVLGTTYATAKPLATGYGAPPPGRRGRYSPSFAFASDAEAGSVWSVSLGVYGNGELSKVATGFPVNKRSGWSRLGPSGLAYDNKKGTLYVADGACNAVLAIENVPNLGEKDEIVVGAKCKSFRCKKKKDTCVRLVKAGRPLDKPEAMTLLPNGNLVAANTGNNRLVEMTPTGQVLDTKVVDKGKSPAIFGLWATGKNDSDTVLFFTDTNSDNAQELER